MTKVNTAIAENNTAAEMEVTYLPLAEVAENPKNRRLDQATVDQIAATFGYTGGLLQAIEVTPSKDGGYMVTDGHHRYAAAKQAGLESIPCVIVDGLSDEDRFLRALIPNISRKEMTYSEKVQVMKHLAETNSNIDPVEVARKLGVRPSTAAEMLFVAELPDGLIAKADGNAEYRAKFHRFARLAKENRKLLVDGMNAYFKQTGEYPNPQRFEVALNRVTLSIANACFDTTECIRCPHNTNCQTGLFADNGDAEEGSCTNAECYSAKEQDAIASVAVREAEKFGVPSDNITHYQGDKNITVDIVPVQIGKTEDAVNARPWRDIELNDNAEGCQGCEHRIIVTQKQPGRVVAQCACVNISCYKDLMPNEMDKTPAPETAEAKKQTVADTLTRKVSNKANVDASSLSGNALVQYRRKFIEKHVANAVNNADGLAQLKGALLLISVSSDERCYISESTLTSLLETPDPKEVKDALIDVLARSVSHLSNSNLVRMFNLVSTEEAFKKEWTHKDVDFLKGLTRAQLLGLLEQAGLSSDEDFWAKAKKAKKGDEKDGLVKIVLDADFNGYVPNEVLPKAIA